MAQRIEAMMRFDVIGTDKRTGAAVSRRVSAVSNMEAERQAEESGIAVQYVLPRTSGLRPGTVALGVLIGLLATAALCMLWLAVNDPEASGQLVTGILAIVLLLTLVGVGLLVLLLPLVIASARKHPNTVAITVCALCGLILLPAWIVALVWSCTAIRRV